MPQRTALASTLLVLTACTSAPQGVPSAPTAQPAVLGMANPASQYCVQLGGTLRLVNTAGGVHGLCTLPDGTEIEEWALYRRDHPVR